MAPTRALRISHVRDIAAGGEVDGPDASWGEEGLGGLPRGRRQWTAESHGHSCLLLWLVTMAGRSLYSRLSPIAHWAHHTECDRGIWAREGTAAWVTCCPPASWEPAAGATASVVAVADTNYRDLAPFNPESRARIFQRPASSTCDQSTTPNHPTPTPLSHRASSLKQPQQPFNNIPHRRNRLSPLIRQSSAPRTITTPSQPPYLESTRLPHHPHTSRNHRPTTWHPPADSSRIAS